MTILTLVKPVRFLVRLNTPRGAYCYDSERCVFTMPSGIEVHVEPKAAWNMINATVRHCIRHAIPYTYNLENLTHD